MTDDERLARAVDSHEFAGDPYELCVLLAAEIRGLRADLALACRVFSKYTHTGRLDMGAAWHEARGRRMAGLRAEPAAQGVGDPMEDVR